MFYTVTLNPSVDRTIQVPVLQPGGLHRITGYTDNAGGKGINVARALVKLGADCIAIGFLGGANGKWICRTLEQEGVTGSWVWIQGETRMNIKIWAEKTGQTTEFNAAGPVISPQEWDDLFHLLSTLSATSGRKSKGQQRAAEDIIVFSGNPPPGSPTDVYARLIEIAKKQGLFTVLDTNGAYLKAGLAAKPDLVKPNADELRELVGKDCSTPEACAAAAKELMDSGVSAVVVSMGAAGAVCCHRSEILLATPPQVAVRSTVGCGDALVAGTIYGLGQGLSWPEIARWAVACGTAAAVTQGTEPGTRQMIEEILAQTTVRSLVNGR